MTHKESEYYAFKNAIEERKLTLRTLNKLDINIWKADVRIRRAEEDIAELKKRKSESEQTRKKIKLELSLLKNTLKTTKKPSIIVKERRWPSAHMKAAVESIVGLPEAEKKIREYFEMVNRELQEGLR